MAVDRPSPGPVYEVTLSIDRDVADAFDEWLAAHVRDMLELPGFVRAVTWSAEDEDPARVRRVTQYFLENDAALEAYLAGPAERMRQEGLARFPGRFTATRRVLHHADTADEVSAPVASCLNCGSLLTGQYCASCGQRAKSRLISIFELVRDAVGDLFELDSRLWRTLIPLTVRPGRLTREYLMGRRARYMPPFRTYLVLSLVFFLVAFFDPGETLGLLFPAAPDEAAEPGEAAAESGEAARIRDEVLRDLEAEGIDVGAARRAIGEANEAAEAAESEAQDATERSGINLQCDIEDFDNLPGWLSRRLTPERARQMCERVTADGGRVFVRQLLDNIPASLFILLPLMAFVLKVLYPMSKRYYAEHLLFVLHYHAFLFLILTADVLFSRLVTLLRLPGFVEGIATAAVAIYIPVYLYKSLRHVYGQGHLLTTFKFFVLVTSYFLGLVFILVIVMLYTAISL
jgi:hypothetical protein